MDTPDDNNVVPLRLVPATEPPPSEGHADLESMFKHMLARSVELKATEGRNVNKAIVILLDNTEDRYWVMSSFLDMKRSEIVSLLTYVTYQQLREISGG